MMSRAAHRSLRFRVARGLVLVALAWLGTCVPTAAQIVDTSTGSSRPYRGLFGGAATSRSDRPHSLNFTASVFAGYDDDIFARGQGSRPSNSNATVGGQFLGAQASTNYLRRFRHSSFSANAASALRWLPDSDELVPTFYSASVGYQTQIGPRVQFAARHTTAYRPFFSVVPFPGGATVGSSLDSDAVLNTDEPTDLGFQGPDDFTVSSDRTGLTHYSSAQLSRRLTPKSSVQVTGGFRTTDFGSSELDDVNNTRWNAAASYNYDLTRYASARLGYGYRTFRTRDGNTSDVHNIILGINYAQPLVFQYGRTQLSFTTGTALLVRDRLSEDGDAGQRTVFRATGTAALVHAFRAPWQAQLTYTRSVAFLDGLSDPYQGDQVMASLGGLLTRSLDMSMSAGYLSGAVGLRERNFDTTMAGVRLRQAITQNLALFAQYFYYQYSFTDDVAEQLIVAPELQRQGFRAGLTLWLPLIR